MSKRLAALLAMVFVALACLQTPAFADDLDVVKIDVANVANGYYKADGTEGTSSDYCYLVEDGRICLNSTAVVFELTGSTSKSVTIINSSKPTDAFNIRLNGAELSNGINIQNSGYETHVSVEVPAGTTNTVNKLVASNLTISGAGTVSAEYVGTSQVTGATLHITDTHINAETTRNYSEFNGECVIDGDAVVRFTSSTDYAPLHVGETGRFEHSLTLRDNAKLYCLYNDPDEITSSYADGLSISGGAKLTLEGNSYLEANAKHTQYTDQDGNTVDDGGSAIITNGDIEVKDAARVVTKAYGVAISAGGQMSVSGEGSTLEATSEYSNALYSWGGDVKFGSGSFVNLKGYWATVWVEDGDLELDDAFLQVESENDVALFSKGDISIKNSMVRGTADNKEETIRAWYDVTVDNSWLDLTSSTGEGVTGTITNSVLINNNVGTVIGDAVTPRDALALVSSNQELTIPEGTSLTVGDDATLENNGTVNVIGTFSVGNGELVCNSHSGGAATCVKGALCGLCQTEYTDADPANHVDLVHVEAKAATTAAEGNIEYWHCDACGKYFADAAAEKEIKQADTVTAKLPEQQKPADTKPADGDKGNSGNANKPAADKKGNKAQLPATGDSNNAMLPLVAALAGIAVLAGGAVVSKR